MRAAFPGVSLQADGVRADVPQAREASTCGGCQIHVTDRQTFQPVLAGVLLTEAFRAAALARSNGGSLRTSTSTTKLPFDILAGTSETRDQIERGVPAEAIARSWDRERRGVHDAARSSADFCGKVGRFSASA